MFKLNRRKAIGAAALLGLTLSSPLAFAAGSYDTGASDSEVRIGNTVPFSGPASAYGVNALAMKAVFDRINAEGGINGRKITLISLDDAYNPAKTLEQTRKLVEQERVLFIAQAIGTAQNVGIQRYLNQRKIPHLLVGSGGKRWNDPETYPWTTAGLVASSTLEGFTFARHALSENPDAKIAILYQNDDLGKELMEGVEEGLGDKAGQIVARASFEMTDPSVDSQMIALHGSGADVLMLLATPKATAQALRKAADLGWKPARYVASVGASIAGALIPAGTDVSTGVLTGAIQRDPSDPEVQKTPEYAQYVETLKQYYPEARIDDASVLNGYNAAHATAEIIRKAGDNLTRENILAVARNIEMKIPMMLPEITFRTTPDNHFIVRGMRMGQFDGSRFIHFGDVIERN